VVPPVLRAARVSCAPEAAFGVFTEQLAAWWPLPTHSVFGDRAGGVALEGGRLVERAVDGTESVWGEVLAWEPPHRLVLSWHPGQAPDEASEVEVRFLADGDGTRVELEHRGWERFGESAMARRRPYVGPGAWGHVLDHFAGLAEPRSDGPDLTALRAAYAAFFDEASAGGFGPAPAGEWDAPRVLAHVALNDLAMTATAHAIVHRRTGLEFRNLVCQDPDVLAAEVARSVDDRARVARGRRLADAAMVALSRLDEDQLATPVHCVLHHDGEVALDDVLPWGRLAVELQAARHLPAHTGQLADLRPGPAPTPRPRG
jgi:uncharacterized protein YndB with AHSA1/START domain